MTYSPFRNFSDRDFFAVFLLSIRSSRASTKLFSSTFDKSLSRATFCFAASKFTRAIFRYSFGNPLSFKRHLATLAVKQPPSIFRARERAAAAAAATVLPNKGRTRTPRTRATPPTYNMAGHRMTVVAPISRAR